MTQYKIMLSSNPSAHYVIKAKTIGQAWDKLAQRIGYGSFGRWCEMINRTKDENKARFTVKVVG
jgi:hypothetical protein